MYRVYNCVWFSGNIRQRLPKVRQKCAGDPHAGRYADAQIRISLHYEHIHQRTQSPPPRRKRLSLLQAHVRYRVLGHRALASFMALSHSGDRRQMQRRRFGLLPAQARRKGREGHLHPQVPQHEAQRRSARAYAHARTARAVPPGV